MDSQRTIPSGGVFGRSAIAQVRKELLWRSEERIALENPTDDDRWMGSQNINDRIALKLVQPVRANDDIIVLAPQCVWPGSSGT